MKKKGMDRLVVLFLICAVPPVLLLYNQFALYKEPSPLLWGAAVVCLLVFVLCAYIFTGILKH